MHILIVTTSCDALDASHPTGLWLEEFAVPYKAFRKAGFDVTVASPKGGAVPLDPKTRPSESEQKKWADALAALAASQRLADLKDRDFDAIYLPGGHGPMIDLANDATLHALVARHDAHEKVIGAVCHGPAALAKAVRADGQPFFKGRRVTAFTNTEEKLAGLASVVPFLLQDAMAAAGANFRSALVPFFSHIERDGHLITGQNPNSSAAIGKAMIEALQMTAGAAG